MLHFTKKNGNIANVHVGLNRYCPTTTQLLNVQEIYNFECPSCHPVVIVPGVYCFDCPSNKNLWNVVLVDCFPFLSDLVLHYTEEPKCNNCPTKTQLMNALQIYNFKCPSYHTVADFTGICCLGGPSKQTIKFPCMVDCYLFWVTNCKLKLIAFVAYLFTCLRHCIVCSWGLLSYMLM